MAAPTMFAIDTSEPARPAPRPAAKAGRETPPRRAAGEGLGSGAWPIVIVSSFLRRRWPVIALLGLVGLMIGAAIAVTTPNRYASHAQLLIDPRDLRVLQNEIAPQMMGGDAAIAHLESQVRIMGSDGLRRQVIERLSLAGDPDFGGPSNGPLQRLAGLLGLSGASARGGNDPVLAALDAMDHRVSVRRGERTFVIDITAVTSDPEKSARVANAIAEAYLDDQARARSEQAQRASSALSGRLAELRERVRLAEDRVERYRAENNLVGAGGRLVSEEQLSVTNTQLTQARARTADAQAKFDQVRTLRPAALEQGSAPEALQSASIATLRAQLGAALTREADAQVLYGPQHPLFISAQAQVRDARRQIAEELQRVVQAARAELDRARAAERTLAEQVERLKREALTTNRAAVQMRELERDVEANRQVYQAFLLRARETGEQTGVDSTNARIISAASPPLLKIGPNRKMMAGLGLVAGLMLGALVGLARDVAGGHLPFAPRRDGDEPDAGEATTGLAAPSAITAGAPAFTGAPADRLAATPSAARGRWRQAADAASSDDGAASGPAPRDAKAPLGIALPVIQPRGWRPNEATRSAFHGSALTPIVWDEPGSPFATRIREARDRLAIEETPGRNRKVVVLGLEPGAGASLVALNLALAAAREKATPILVDLGAGPASLSSQFAPDAGLGTDDVLAGSAGLIRAALQDDATGMFFLPRTASSGRRPLPSPAHLRDHLFEQMKRFDAVVIDGGSLLDGALPHLLAEFADDIVVAAPGGLDPDAVTQRIQRALGPDAAKVRVLMTNMATGRTAAGPARLKAVPV